MDSFYEFEQNFNTTKSHQWMADNWHNSVYLSIVYICLISVTKFQMQNRKAFEINRYLFAWNAVLTIFSTIGTIRAIAEVRYVLANHGMVASVCSQAYHTRGSGLWALLFSLSKVLELLDTMFLVLRKKPVIFLHWYHHVTVLMFCWYSYSLNASTGRWFTLVNYTIHSFMYAYYAAQAIGVRVPSKLSKTITIAQIFQMVFGVFINLVSLVLRATTHKSCGVQYQYTAVSLTLYSTYFYLFHQFFKNRYNKTKAIKQK
ncbi:unnamed protein product [Oppiella nova]|uniref:Elongation of very long chain fatty acids protein n=1 Tax=Oppiella nova TaxID=334625 RepID=A0A7R9M3W1_9ACAR|nr:unnamed protein product [Oppiella nova]CAG2170182.1 unnamed protein product [Oppiella nova]